MPIHSHEAKSVPPTKATTPCFPLHLQREPGWMGAMGGRSEMMVARRLRSRARFLRAIAALVTGDLAPAPPATLGLDAAAAEVEMAVGEVGAGDASARLLLFSRARLRAAAWEASGERGERGERGEVRGAASPRLAVAGLSFWGCLSPAALPAPMLLEGLEALLAADGALPSLLAFATLPVGLVDLPMAFDVTFGAAEREEALEGERREATEEELFFFLAAAPGAGFVRPLEGAAILEVFEALAGAAMLLRDFLGERRPTTPLLLANCFGEGLDTEPATYQTIQNFKNIDSQKDTSEKKKELGRRSKGGRVPSSPSKVTTSRRQKIPKLAENRRGD